MRTSTRVGRSYITSETIEVKHYILAFEGIKTEPQYFDGIRRNADTLGINGTAIQCIPLNRSTTEEGYSNPEKGCLPLLETFLEETKHQVMSADTIATRIIDSACDNGLLKRKENQKTLHQIKNRLLEKYLQQNIPRDKKYSYIEIEPIVKLGYDNLCDIIHTRRTEKMYARFIKEIESQMIHITKNDIACLIVDRDKNSFSKEAYEDVARRCEEKNIHFIVSNPQFEFWLLLHFTNAEQYDKEQLLKNQSYLLKQLKEKTGHDPKTIYFDQYKDNVLTAVKNEHKYAETIDKLKDNLGSNVGKLIEELITKPND